MFTTLMRKENACLVKIVGRFLTKAGVIYYKCCFLLLWFISNLIWYSFLQTEQTQQWFMVSQMFKISSLQHLVEFLNCRKLIMSLFQFHKCISVSAIDLVDFCWCSDWTLLFLILIKTFRRTNILYSFVSSYKMLHFYSFQEYNIQMKLTCPLGLLFLNTLKE